MDTILHDADELVIAQLSIAIGVENIEHGLDDVRMELTVRGDIHGTRKVACKYKLLIPL
jgi:hypothetical protein